MCYKTILVHADTARGAADRLRLASRLARASDAHLVGSALTGISRFIPPRVIAEGGPALAECCAAMRRDAAAGLALFGRIVREEGVASFEERLIDDDVDGGMAQQARYCDLVVVGQSDRDAPARGTLGDLPEYLLLHGGRPMLAVPAAGSAPDLRGAALVAWDGSMEATRAVAAALPLLRMAAGVTVMTCGGGAEPLDQAGDPSGRMLGYLRRHGISARAHRRPGGQHVGEALLAEAAELGADLLVMGGYGHSRFRELLLGGATATVLQSMTIPVLLAH